MSHVVHPLVFSLFWALFALGLVYFGVYVGWVLIAHFFPPCRGPEPDRDIDLDDYAIADAVFRELPPEAKIDAIQRIPDWTTPAEAARVMAAVRDEEVHHA